MTEQSIRDELRAASIRLDAIEIVFDFIIRARALLNGREDAARRDFDAFARRVKGEDASPDMDTTTRRESANRKQGDAIQGEQFEAVLGSLRDLQFSGAEQLIDELRSDFRHLDRSELMPDHNQHFRQCTGAIDRLSLWANSERSRLKNALRRLTREAKQAEGNGEPKQRAETVEWSHPDRVGSWAKKLGQSRGTFLKRVKEGMIRIKKITRQSICIAVADLPEYLRPAGKERK